jgi:hypothetical protein
MNVFDTLTGDIEPAQLSSVLINVALALVLGQILAWHYQRFAQVLSNKRKFAGMFVFIAATTVLVISVVKSSLALSLGLVGALSIIRFRTPIKEPEELAYLFLSMAIGIGLGADQRAITVLAFLVILGYLTIRHGARRIRRTRPLRTVVQVTAPMLPGDNGSIDGTGDAELKALLPAVEVVCLRVDLRRVDCHQQEFNASLLIELKDAALVGNLLSGVRDALPGATVSVIEREGAE